MFDGWHSASPVFFTIGDIYHQNEKQKIEKNDFGGFQLQEVREKTDKIVKFICEFSFVV
jgi:hypothetical protein